MTLQNLIKNDKSANLYFAVQGMKLNQYLTHMIILIPPCSLYRFNHLFFVTLYILNLTYFLHP